MKKRMKRNVSMLLTAVLLVLAVNAGFAFPVVAASEETLEIENLLAGNLSAALPINPGDVKALIVTGEFNQKDMNYLYRLNNLEYADLSGAVYKDDKLDTIGNISKLRELYLPCGIPLIGTRALSSQSSLESVVIPDTVTSIGMQAFNDCKKLKTVYMPDSVTSIGSMTFLNCENLQYIRMSNSLGTIFNQAFQDCVNLRAISIPESVTGIGQWAFNGCNNLKTVLFKRDTAPSMDDGFSTNGTFYVPEGKKNAYRAALGSDAIIEEKTMYSITVQNETKGAETEHTALAQFNYGYEDITVELLALTKREAVRGFSPVIPSNLSIINQSFTMPGMATTVRYGEGSPVLPPSRIIEEIESPRMLHMLEGLVTSKDGLNTLVSDIEAVTVKLDDGSECELGLLKTEAENEFTGWRLQSSADSGNTWVDVSDDEVAELLAKVDNSIVLRLIACVDYRNQTPVLTMPADYIYAEVPVNIYDMQSHPLQLTEGNSDLYHNPTAGATVIGELASRGTTAEDHKFDLVFYYLWESYAKRTPEADEEYVSKYVEPEDSSYKKMISKIEGEDVDTWLSTNPDATIEVIESVAKGETSQLYETHIQPRHSSARNDYFTPNVRGSVLRGTEYYIITYKVTKRMTVYIGKRDVKLRYKSGDVNLSGVVDGTDANLITDYVGARWTPFLDADGNAIMELVNQAVNFDQNPIADGTDANLITDYVGERWSIPKLRF